MREVTLKAGLDRWIGFCHELRKGKGISGRRRAFNNRRMGDGVAKDKNTGSGLKSLLCHILKHLIGGNLFCSSDPLLLVI